MTNPYLDALAKIPAGETRSFMELAALAGRPGAARAAGRAMSQCPPSLAWHRIVRSDGRPRDSDERGVNQLRRLRREGARPRARESISGWAKRVNARFVGHYPSRNYERTTSPDVVRWRVEQVEPFASEAAAIARGFFPVGQTAEQSQEPGFPKPLNDAASVELLRESWIDRVDGLDWKKIGVGLAQRGLYRFASLLSPEETSALALASSSADKFERTVRMAPKGYGLGAYHYYKEPIPEPARRLRALLYERLAPLANELWPKTSFPSSLEAFWERCRDAGQQRASSILIGYPRGGINHPHRDIYGKVWFPFQALVVLSKRSRDFEGGNFYVTDEPEASAIPTRLVASSRECPVDEGDVVVFATRERFESGRRIPLRHGMTLVTRGSRFGIGLVFHLAE